ncbi:MAPEG family protein [Rhodovulum euryhalinum]|uniref:Putative MAPEG superfamily protein n=1 Tax=Rhodovulum euryhalinum TaxID=35805 RepID=A0A4R2KHW7_9RHOB|nr:MAPEG family protein [Rhodovulum euryhalinum]TCO72052.1 putative MAPEG superfamily protein [Rhodovulum euryhalinum]
MTPELTALALAILLQAVQLILLAIPANMELGANYTAGPRDTPPDRPLSPRTARLQRALNNHFEALILFTAATALVTLSGQSSLFTAICAFAYLGARILYIPAYALGWSPGRSILWGVGFLATLLMTLAALL